MVDHLRRALCTCVASLLLIGVAGCRSEAGSLAADGPWVGNSFYTKFPLRLDPRSGYRTTNYRTEQLALLPINTRVELVSSRGRRVTCRLESGKEFFFEHVADHSQDTMDAALDKTFAQSPVDLSRFSDEEKRAIGEGRAIEGMTRDEVLVAMGPAPGSLNPLGHDGQEWFYQDNRWVKMRVRFGEDGTVTQVGR